MATKSHVITLGYQVGSTATSKSYTKTGEAEQNLDFDIASTTTPHEVSFTMTASMMKAIFLNSNYQTHVKTRSTSAPGDSFTLKADKPLVWTDDFSSTSPFTTNVDKLYFYNTSGTTATVTGYSVYDAIP